MNALNGPAVPVSAPLGPDPAAGVRPGAAGVRSRGAALRAVPLAPVRALALFGLSAAGAALFTLVAGPAVLALIGVIGVLHQLSQHQLSLHGGSGQAMLAVLFGVAWSLIVSPRALLVVRRLTATTRRLLWRWRGVVIRSSYHPPPAGTARRGQPGVRRLGYRQRMTWLLTDPATGRDMAWLAVNAFAGTVLLLAPIVVAFGGACLGLNVGLAGIDRILGGVLVVAGLGGAPWALRAYARLAVLVLAPDGHAELEQRVAYLAQTRQESLEVGAAELRRIERDLHDGAQARLVAMGLTLDAAGRLIDTDTAAARALLLEARDASAKALAELRDLVRGVHPPVLADRGLADAVRALALDAPVRVRVTGGLNGRLPAPVESAAYFAVSELLANVAKHAGAQSAEIDLRHDAGALRISVRDDGTGGADPARGTGLAGVERRLAAFDGVLAVASPPGGPTVITLDVPCPRPAQGPLDAPYPRGDTCALS